jgi:hypothetical protein
MENLLEQKDPEFLTQINRAHIQAIAFESAVDNTVTQRSSALVGPFVPSGRLR